MQDFEVSFTAGVTFEDWNDPALPPNPPLHNPLHNPALPVGPGNPPDIDPNHNPALPVGPGAPSRLHPIEGYPHKMYVGTVGTEIELTATVGGVDGPMDAALGGRTFVPWRVENPPPHVFGFTSPAGQSSVIRFTPPAAGHYCVGVGRTGGGAVLMHFDVAP